MVAKKYTGHYYCNLYGILSSARTYWEGTNLARYLNLTED